MVSKDFLIILFIILYLSSVDSVRSPYSSLYSFLLNCVLMWAFVTNVAPGVAVKIFVKNVLCAVMRTDMNNFKVVYRHICTL